MNAGVRPGDLELALHLLERQKHRKRGAAAALANAADDVDRTFVLLDDAAAYPQPKARSLLAFSGVEGREQIAPDTLGDALPAVDDGGPDSFALGVVAPHAFAHRTTIA